MDCLCWQQGNLYKQAPQLQQDLCTACQSHRMEEFKMLGWTFCLLAVDSQVKTNTIICLDKLDLAGRFFHPLGQWAGRLIFNPADSRCMKPWQVSRMFSCSTHNLILQHIYGLLVQVVRYTQSRGTRPVYRYECQGSRPVSKHSTKDLHPHLSLTMHFCP